MFWHRDHGGGLRVCGSGVGADEILRGGEGHGIGGGFQFAFGGVEHAEIEGEAGKAEKHGDEDDDQPQSGCAAVAPWDQASWPVHAPKARFARSTGQEAYPTRYCFGIT